MMMWRAQASTRNFELSAYGNTEAHARRTLGRMWDDWRKNTGATITTEELLSEAYVYQVKSGMAFMDGEEYK